MSLFKGFTDKELVAMNPLLLIAILSQQLSITNQALQAVSEELRQVKMPDNKPE